MPSEAFRHLDSPELRAFHRRVTVLSAAGMFLDGYDITVIAVALPVLTKQWNITSSFLTGALASSAIVGMLVGALVFGRLTDRLGRKKMYLIDLLGFVLFAALTACSQNPWELLVFRFMLGLSLGADYSISPALLAEYAPARRRGTLMCRLSGTWFVGSAATYVFALVFLPLGDDGWRYMLLLGAVFALVVVWMRRVIPESPRWLTDRGRTAEAAAVLAGLGAGPEPGGAVPVPVESAGADAMARAPWRALFSRRLIRLTLFCCGFWFMYTVAYYGITFYTPTILKQVTSSTAQSYAGSLVVGVVGVIGAVIGISLVDRVGRRPLLITGFAGLVIALGVLVAFGSPPLGALITLIGFAVLFCNSGPGIVNMIYPSEVFPTAIRATASGFATAVSRVGAFVGTQFFPQIVKSWGMTHALWVFIGAGVIGLVIAATMAPETKQRTLEEIAVSLGTEPKAPRPVAAVE